MDEGLSNAVKEVFNRPVQRRPDLPWQTPGELGTRSRATPISDPEAENRESSAFHAAHPLSAGRRRENRRRVKITGRRHHPSAGNYSLRYRYVNPEDPRYQSLIGNLLFWPLVNRRIPIPAGDEHADMERRTAA